MFKRTVHCAPLLPLAMLLGLTLLCGATESAQEYKVKAAFIYNFARFIEWPTEAFSSAEASFVIGVIGSDPFNGALEQAVINKKVGPRRVEVQHYESVDDIGPCQILFVATNDDDLQGRIIRKTASNHVLLIGESESFNSAGGCFRFFTEDNKIRFAVNTDAADRASLRISSKLLKLARIFQR